MSAEAVHLVSVKSTVVDALQKASAATGSDFKYLLGTAIRESGLKPGAQSASSSASGLFQFVEQTWLGLVKEYGAKHGLGSYANAITQGSNGHYHAGNAGDRQAILALRNDPQSAALMAGEYAGQCKSRMESSLGREVGGGELYAAHFLGADSACKLIRLSETAPNTSAAGAFPQAANANRTVFYHSDGSPKTVSEVYHWATNQLAPSVKVAAAAPAESNGAAQVVASLSTANEALLVSMLLQPSEGGFFSGGAAGSSSPFLLTPGVLDVLSEQPSHAVAGKRDDT